MRGKRIEPLIFFRRVFMVIYFSSLMIILPSLPILL